MRSDRVLLRLSGVCQSEQKAAQDKNMKGRRSVGHCINALQMDERATKKSSRQGED